MKKTKIIIVCLFLLICVLVICLATCGANKNKGVPDDFAIRAVDACPHANSQSSTYVTHNKYDSESYLDYVTIVSKSEGDYGYFVSTCEAIFQYNRTSDLWVLLDAEKWTEPSYKFTDALVGRYDLTPKYEHEKSSGHVEILSVTDKEIQLYYDISSDVHIVFNYFEDLHIEKSERITLPNKELSDFSGTPYIRAGIKLPEGWCSSSGGDQISLIIEIDITTGVKYIYVLGDVVRKNSN